MKHALTNVTAFVGDHFERRDDVNVVFDIDTGLITGISHEAPADDVSRIDGRNFFLTPGFVNAHFHPSQLFNRALGVGWSHERQMDLLHACDRIRQPADALVSSQLSILEGLRAGTTCFNSVGSAIEPHIAAFQQMGVRAACTLIPKDIVNESKHHAIRADTWDVAERLALAEGLHTSHHGELVRVHFGVVNVRYASDELIGGMKRLAAKYRVAFHMHAAETREYVEAVRHRTGKSPIAHLASLGVLDDTVALAHCVHLSQQDIQLLQDNHAHVVHCPRANSYMAVGVCPVAELMEAGVSISLGSDAAINNNSNEVRGEARAVSDTMAVLYERPDVVPLLDLFRMLTVHGARAMGIGHLTGSVEVGKQADFVLWSKNDLPFIPGHDFLADLIFTDSCRAHSVFIHGQPVLRNYACETIDEQALIGEAREIAARYATTYHHVVKAHLTD